MLFKSPFIFHTVDEATEDKEGKGPPPIAVGFEFHSPGNIGGEL